MKKALLVMLLMLSAAYLTFFAMTNLVDVNAQSSYSHSFHGVKILSPTRGEEVPVNIQNFVVRGVSTDNSTNNCELSLLPNGITPYLEVNAKGQGGSRDFSAWDRQFGSEFPMNVGENKITARLMCMNDDVNNKTSKYQTINFTGVSDDSGLTPATPATATPDNTNAPIPSSVPSASTAEENSSRENRSSILETENKLEDASYKNLEKRITFGPVIIPSHQDATIKELAQKEPDAVTIPAQDKKDHDDKQTINVDMTTIPSNITESSNTSNTDSLNGTFTDSTAPTEVIIPATNVTTITVPFCLSTTVNDQSRTSPIEEVQSEGSQSSLPSSDMPFVLLTPSPNLRQGEQLLQDKTEQVVPKQLSSPITILENNDSKVKEGSIVSLNASDSCFRDGTTVSQVWKQPTNHIIENLGDFDSSILTFRAPNVYHDTALQFELITSDTEGNSESTNVKVLVEDAAADVPINSTNQSNVRVPSGPGSETVESASSNVVIPDQSDQISSNLLNKSIEDPKPSENISSERSPMGVTGEKSEPIKAFAGIDQVVNEGMGVTLQGDITSSIGKQDITYKWSQISGEPHVALEELGDNKGISFTAPEVSGDTLFTFRLDISSADKDLVSSDEVKVTIKDIAEPADGDNEPDRLDDTADNSDDDEEEEDEDEEEEDN